MSQQSIISCVWLILLELFTKMLLKHFHDFNTVYLWLVVISRQWLSSSPWAQNPTPPTPPLPQAVCLWFCCCVLWTVRGGGQRALWEQWPGSVGCCSWSINGPVSADLLVTQESIYNLHLIHELQACDGSEAALWDVWWLDRGTTWGSNSWWAAGEDGGGSGTLPLTIFW